MNNLFCNASKWLRYALVLLCCLSSVAAGLPAGGIISVGTGSIASSGGVMTITLDSPGTVIDWTNFSIGANETVSIVQPSSTSTALLRAIGVDPSQILGKLQSNGRVFLVSPSGILFGSSATVDAAGLVSSTLNISNQNFLVNQLQFASGVDSGGSVVIYEGSGTVAVIDVQGGGTVTFNSGSGTYGSVSSTGLVNQASTGTASPPDSVASTITVASSGINIGTLTLGALNQTYNGSVPEVRCTTIPANLSTSISFSDIGSGSLSQNVGNYGATCTVTQPGYSGSVSGTLVISPLLLNVTAASGVHMYDATAAGVQLSSSGLVLGDTVTFAGTNTSAGTINTSGVSATGINTSYAASNYGVGGLVSSGGSLTITSATCMTCASNNTAINLLATVPGSTAGLITLSSASSVSFTSNPLTLASNTITLSAGWNLIGSGVDALLDVVAAFGDTRQINTVWKWVHATGRWAFYTPAMTHADLAIYTAGKGYDVLTTVNAGEGFWVNAKVPGSISIPAGNAYFPALATGWNLVAQGAPLTPSEFNILLSSNQPASGVALQNITSLWAWDSIQSNWYFYAPSLEANGTLPSYIASKGYLDFTAASKTLGPGIGFWVNKP
ncbi:MAG: filamentous hemagglutinin N-terminal domain-containing protein [Gallionellaceae bacterium]|jgi:filamentous hemagglutinin family protein